VILVVRWGVVVVEGNKFYKLVGCEKNDNKRQEKYDIFNLTKLENLQINPHPFFTWICGLF
jgi:hypothetical protein